MTYTKRRFGAELILILEQEDFDINKISRWADNMYLKSESDDLDDIIRTISAIDCGPEFELTKEEILQIALDCVQ